MRMTIDLDLDRAVFGSTRQEIDFISFKRLPVAAFEIQFTRDGVVVALPPGALGVFELKKVGKYDSAPLTGAAAWTQNGVGTGTYYTFLVPLILPALDALFFVDGNPENDVKELTFMGEVSWKISGRDYKTQTLTCKVANDVNREDDEIPDPVIIYTREVLTCEVLAAEDLPAFQPVTAAGVKGNSTTLAHAGHVIGITAAAIASGFVGTVIMAGEVSNEDWTWAATNLPLYLNGNDLSTIPPDADGAGFAQQLAVTRNNTIIYLELREPVTL